jgi:hypothetical protein
MRSNVGATGRWQIAFVFPAYGERNFVMMHG